MWPFPACVMLIFHSNIWHGNHQGPTGRKGLAKRSLLVSWKATVSSSKEGASRPLLSQPWFRRHLPRFKNEVDFVPRREMAASRLHQRYKAVSFVILPMAPRMRGRQERDRNDMPQRVHGPGWIDCFHWIWYWGRFWSLRRAAATVHCNDKA